MKIIATIVSDVEDVEDAISEYNFINERWPIVSFKLDGKDWCPALEEEE